MRVCPKCKLEYRDEHVSVCADDGTALEAAPDPRLGKLVGGRYLLERPLGEGGMATVYAAHHTLIERPLAVKVLHKHLAHDATLRERFTREARSAATIAHENVIEIYDLGETEDGCPFIVMELLTGEPLRKLVERGPMDPALVCELGAQMARGLARAHDLGIVHRDLKPENAFVGKRADGSWLAKLVDFGIAQSKKDARLTARGSLVGTPQYLAPERIKGTESGAPSDLYAFGVLLFEMVTGRVPFLSNDLPGFLLQHMEAEPPKPSSLAPSCPERLEQLILRLLAKEPKDRPVDMHEVVRELEATLATLSPGRASAKVDADATTQAAPRPKALPPVTLEHLERRALVYRQLLRRAFADAPPAELERRVASIQASVDELAKLRSRRVAVQKKLDALDADTRDARERLGHAVHELGVDLSTARAELRAAEQVVTDKTSEVRDLEFQLEALRAKLADTERDTDTKRHDANDEIEKTGRELETRQAELDRAAQAFLAEASAIPALAPLVRTLTEGD